MKGAELASPPRQASRPQLPQNRERRERGPPTSSKAPGGRPGARVSQVPRVTLEIQVPPELQGPQESQDYEDFMV